MSRLNEETYEKIYNDFLEKLKANAQSRNLSSIDEEDFASQMFLELYYKILKSNNYESLLKNRTKLQELERIRADWFFTQKVRQSEDGERRGGGKQNGNNKGCGTGCGSFCWNSIQCAERRPGQ